ncbi:MAG: hypothetical protein WA421_11155 [Nitrososphaeraceae archaeon]
MLLRIKRRAGNLFSKAGSSQVGKDCCEAQFKLSSEGHSIMYVQTLEEKLTQIEEAQQPK